VFEGDVMVKTETKLNGDLSAMLSKFEKNVQEKVVFAGVAAMAKVMYDEAKNNVPVKTGTLKEAIYRVYSPEKSTDTRKTYRISWNRKKAPHGHLIEFGTSRAPAYPFIRPAFDHIGRAIAEGNRRMKEVLDEAKS
jgi:HK97 gp10 family phage protein